MGTRIETLTEFRKKRGVTPKLPCDQGSAAEWPQVKSLVASIIAIGAYSIKSERRVTGFRR